MRTSDELIREFHAVRVLRDRLKRERDSLLCERHEGGPPADWDWDNGGTLPESAPPCWKTARQWGMDPDSDSKRSFYFDPPPSEWCASCRRRQEASDAYREAVKRHGGALRGLLRRGKALSVVVARTVNAVDPQDGVTPA